MLVQDPDGLLTVHEVAEKLRVDDTTVRRWIKHGTLDAVALPHSGKRQAYRIRKSTMENLLSGTKDSPQDNAVPAANSYQYA